MDPLDFFSWIALFAIHRLAIYWRHLVLVRRKIERKVIKAVAAGALVWIVASVADVALIPIDHSLIPRFAIANLVGALVAVIVSLAFQLKHEEVHFQVAMERAAIVAELNHHIRNAIFPMHLTLQTLGNADAKKISEEAVERVNIALKDANTDALSGRVDYSAESTTGQE